MDIRKIARLNPNYSQINREERNYAAILFAALCKPGNAELFLQKCGINQPLTIDFGIYFEYAYLRELWYQINDEQVKKEIIRQNLSIQNIDEILNLPVVEINRKFGVSGEPSREFIQYPGKWALVKYQNNFSDNNDFLKICRFKWAFNIKPDIVIHIDKNNVLCIEAKYESGEGFYPSSEKEKEIFRARKMTCVGQLELQKYMMEELLGIKSEFMFLVLKKEKCETHRVITWDEVFKAIDVSWMPEFAREMVGNVVYKNALT